MLRNESDGSGRPSPKRHLSKEKSLRSFIRIGPPKRKDPSYREDDKPLTLLSNKYVPLLNAPNMVNTSKTKKDSGS
jgi:hypothetical protein